MIVTQIYKGQGLGNQLWCYATTRVIAADRGVDFGIMTPENIKCNDFMNLDFGSPVIGGTGPEGGPPETLPRGITNYYKERLVRHPISNADISLHDPDLVNIPDNTKIDGTMQDEQYILHRKKEIQEWLKVKEEFECYDYSSDDICVINFRGGEYQYIKDVFLPKKYWNDAIREMRKINPNFSFVVITDDVATAKKFFPNFEVYHFSIAKDFVIIKNAHYLIIANTSFAWFPAWLNENLKLCIAPKYWWAHNNSDGYWACNFNLTNNWKYLDRQGGLHDYGTCLKERDAYVEGHQEYYYPKKIETNHLVVSSFDNDLSWLPRRTKNYTIFHRGQGTVFPYTIDHRRIIASPNVGYNIYDYCTYIIDHYEQLPETVVFVKGNVFPRHVTESYFDSISNRSEFTPIIEPRLHKTQLPSSYFDDQGMFCEINNSWYLNEHPVKYFHDYNDFLRFCYQSPEIPRYVRFAPGGNYLVPKKNILKFPKVFYENLRTFVSYTPLSGEAHIIERALYTLWTSDAVLNENMLKAVDQAWGIEYPYRPRRKSKVIIDTLGSFKDPRNLVREISKRVPSSAKHAAKKSYKLAGYMYRTGRSKFIDRQRSTIRKTLTSIKSLDNKEFRKHHKVYDAFYFFNELEVLEIRLNILDPFVDYFVIVEATETFSGLPKPLIFQENRDRFKKFAHKIIHWVTTDSPQNEEELRTRLYQKNLSALDREIILNALTTDNVPKGEVHWLKEFYQKESLKKALSNLADNDFCFVSDVDEIWNPEAPIDYSRNDLYKYKQDAYFYFLNNRSNDNWQTGWTGTVATKYVNIKNNCLNHLRTHTKNTYTVIDNGGWHFTFQGGAEKIRRKLESYGHQEFNNDAIKSQLEKVLAENRDYRGRRLRFWVDETKLPPYLIANKYRYQQLFRQ